VKVTLHSHDTPSLLLRKRSRIHALTGQHLRYVRSESCLRWIQPYQIFFRLWYRRGSYGRYGG